MMERTIATYTYIPEKQIMRTKHSFDEDIEANQSVEENEAITQQQTRSFVKHQVRRRVEQSRNVVRRCSDAGSDTGSDGVAVNSGGSGRSGDWGPPKLRTKAKYSRRRSDQRASFTDSGISLAKTDSGDFSELSNQPCTTIHDLESSLKQKYDVYSDSSNERRRHQVRQPIVTKSRAKTDANQNTNHQLIKRSHSCSALPSNIKPLDRHNPRISNQNDVNNSQLDVINSIHRDFEAKESAILQQCIRNEGFSSHCIQQDCCYMTDCSTGRSKFPLPERLNYPLNKYYKSDTNLNRISLQPLKKLRSSLRKLKSKNSLLTTPERYTSRSDVYSSRSDAYDNTIDSLDSKYLNFLCDNESSEVIMARLAKNPNPRKAWLKKMFKWKLGKSYKCSNEQKTIIYSEPASKKSSNLRPAHSTRSIPDAIKGMWNKLHERNETNEFDHVQAEKPMTRASSMPSIATHRVTKQKIGDVIYFHEKGFEENKNKNIFLNFFKPMEQTTTPLKGGNDVITSVLGGSTHDLSKQQQSSKSERHVTHFENNNDNPEQMKQSECYTSFQDLREYYDKQLQQYPSCPAPHCPPSQCPCCGNSQYTPPQFLYAPEQASQPKPPAVLAPLDVKVSSERRAERRKICEMVFDTFV